MTILFNNEITCVFSFSTTKEKVNDFKSLISIIVAETQKEPGTLSYIYSISDDQVTINIIERYKDSSSLISHVTTTFSPFAADFLSFVQLKDLTVHGMPSDEVKEILRDFSPKYMTPFNGFSK
jgi:quinol monooxygenase YgiN